MSTSRVSSHSAAADSEYATTDLGPIITDIVDEEHEMSPVETSSPWSSPEDGGKLKWRGSTMSRPGEIAGLSDSSVDVSDINDERVTATEHLRLLNMEQKFDVARSGMASFGIPPSNHDFGYIASDGSSTVNQLSDEDDSSEDDDESELNSEDTWTTTGFKKAISVRTHSQHSNRSGGRETIQEGYLLKYNGRFHGWRRRWCCLVGGKLHYSKSSNSDLQVEMSISNCSVAEESNRNSNNGFEVYGPLMKITLRAESRPKMEDWMRAFTRASKTVDTPTLDSAHHWYLRTNKGCRCNVCGDSLGKSRSMACAVCQLRVHKKCAPRATDECKWTTLASIKDQTPGSRIPHQWMQGNLRNGSKCIICGKSCGSSKKLADYRCIWCHQTVHSTCRLLCPLSCSLGRHRLSILSPSGIILMKNSAANTKVKLVSRARIQPSLRDKARLLGDELDENKNSSYTISWEIIPEKNTSPLIVFVNTKSGGHEGVRVLRTFKTLLNPAQVFDLSNLGPNAGLELMKNHVKSFRAIGCGGDGTIGWILHEAEKMGLTRLKLGILPLGTGNDLSRVLGWGPSFNADWDNVVKFIDSVEQSKVQAFDRWGIAVRSNEARDILESSVNTSRDASPVGSSGDSKTNDTYDGGDPEIIDSEDDDQKSLRVVRGKARRGSAVVNIHQSVDMDKQVAKIKRFGRFLTVFFKSVEEMCINGDTNTSDVSADDLYGMVEDYVSTLRVLTDANSGLKPQLNDDGNDVLDTLCDELEERTNTFVKLIFSEGSTDDEVYDSLTEVRASVENASANALTRIDAEGEPEWAPEPDALAASKSVKISEAPVIKRVSNQKALLGKKISVRLRGKQSAGPDLDTKKLDADYGKDQKATMNNYFGIGLDAKVAMDFDQFRKSNPEKCRTRMKNQMWYGVLGTKEMMHQTCKNLHHRLVLECDGEIINLPKLQGIVVLNISSYMGGTNVWGTKVEKRFRPQAFDDGLLEVVSVKSSAQMAAIKSLPGIFPTRIAQARQIKILVKSGEPVPIQVDGETWMQEANCTITIFNKGKVQMLTRDKALMRLMMSWSEKDKIAAERAACMPGAEEDETMLGEIDQAAKDLIISFRVIALKMKIAAQQLERACSCVEIASKKLHKGFGKGKIKQKRVLEYLSTIGMLIESGTVIMAQDGKIDSPNKSKRKSSAWATKGSSFSLQSIDVDALDDGGSDMKNQLKKCHEEFDKVVELCNDPRLTKLKGSNLARIPSDFSDVETMSSLAISSKRLTIAVSDNDEELSTDSEPDMDESPTRSGTAEA